MVYEGFLFQYTIVYCNPIRVKTAGITLPSEIRWCPGAAATNPYIIDLLGIIIKYMDQLMYQQNIDTSPKTLNGWP